MLPLCATNEILIRWIGISRNVQIWLITANSIKVRGKWNKLTQQNLAQLACFMTVTTNLCLLHHQKLVTNEIIIYSLKIAFRCEKLWCFLSNRAKLAIITAFWRLILPLPLKVILHEGICGWKSSHSLFKTENWTLESFQEIIIVPLTARWRY